MMKIEQKQLVKVLEALIITILFAVLYTVAGSTDFGGLKWLRRFVAPSVFILWAIIRSENLEYLFQIPLMIGALCLPYGSDIFLNKVGLRGLFGLANATATSVINVIERRFIITTIHIFIVTMISIGIGVWNPFSNAIIEQFFIGFMIIFIPALSVKTKD